MEKDVLISAIFPDRAEAERACRELPDHGISIDDVSLISRKGELETPLVEGGGGRHHQPATEHPRAEGASIGAIFGSAVGFIGGMSLLLSGALVMPAIGLVIAGPLVGALAGAGLTRSSKTLVDALRQTGVGEAEARLIEERVRAGGILLAVAVDASRADETRAIFEKLGGEPITVSEGSVAPSLAGPGRPAK